MKERVLFLVNAIYKELSHGRFCLKIYHELRICHELGSDVPLLREIYMYSILHHDT